MDKARGKEISSFEQKTNFLYFTTCPTKCAHRVSNAWYIHRWAGELKLTSEIFLHPNSNQESLLPFFPKFPIFPCFGDQRKHSAPTYLKYSVYKENETALNHFWNFNCVFAKGKDKQKTFNKYYLNSTQCKTFRKTDVSNNLRNFSRISKPSTSYAFLHSFPVLQWINGILRAILG